MMSYDLVDTKKIVVVIGYVSRYGYWFQNNDSSIKEKKVVQAVYVFITALLIPFPK